MSRKASAPAWLVLPLLLLLAIPFCRGFFQGVTGDAPSSGIGHELDDRFYDGVPLGNRARWVLDEIGKVPSRQEAPLSDITCAAVMARCNHNVKDAEDRFKREFQGKRVKWRVHVNRIETYDMVPRGEAPTPYERPTHGAVLHFRCSPSGPDDKVVKADGAALFDANQVNREQLSRFPAGRWIELDATLATYVQWVDGSGGIFLSGIDFNPHQP